MPIKIWSISGPLPGSGSTTLAANIGRALARKGRETVLVDASPGGHGLNDFYGIGDPSLTFEDFRNGRIGELAEAIIATPVKGLGYLGGARAFPQAVTAPSILRDSTVSGLKKAGEVHLVVDIGAARTVQALDLFATSHESIIVLSPEAASVQEAFSFLKEIVYMRLKRLFDDMPFISDIILEATDRNSPSRVKSFADLCGRLSDYGEKYAERALSEIKAIRPRIILNKAKEHDDQKAVDMLLSAAGTYLSIDLDLAGTARETDTAERPLGEGRGLDMDAIMERLLGKAVQEAVHEAHVAEPAEVEETVGFNDNVNQGETTFHVQTEAYGGSNAAIETVVYHGGRIFFSKRTHWKDVDDGSTGLKDFARRQHRAAIAAIKLNKITLQG